LAPVISDKRKPQKKRTDRPLTTRKYVGLAKAKKLVKGEKQRALALADEARLAQLSAKETA